MYFLGSMFNIIFRIALLVVLLGGISVPGVQHVSGMIIYTASAVEAVNGTDVKLKCIFNSSAPVSLPSVSVAWYFQPFHAGREEAVFYYSGRGFPSSAGHFREHVVWSGDVQKKDASITLLRVSPAFNGTYSCRVLNPPDVHGSYGEVELRVVNKTVDGFNLSNWFLSLFEV
ncbi:myelin protein zero-like protein 2 [Sparus aurata]|uniref:myelin protein zero-like protein 2 n=1 Tax=Sparus aurata TaxID=8175 RepID=UPI0011C11BA6|nr:myelin protein zero-like protein 2 [Sparus aurata]